MSGDKELFEMFRNRGTTADQLPSRAIHYIPEETAPAVLAIDRRIQQVRKHQAWFILGAVVLAFLIGVSV